MHKNNKKGFTIVELVIVIAVIAILAAVLIPTFANLAKRANISADTQLIRNLNTALIADSAKNGTHTTMQSALDAAEKFGYDVARINASATDNEILWDSANDVFCYFNADSGEVEYIPETALKTTDVADIDYWVIVGSKTAIADSTGLSDKYSSYVANYSGTGALETTKGIDVSALDGVDVTYETEATQSVVINTNGGTLIVNAPNSVVKHYGDATVLNISSVKISSYHEYGSVSFAEISSGRIALEKGSEVDHIHITKNETTGKFDDIIIAKDSSVEMPALSRDDVEIADGGTLVVALQNGTEEVTEETDLDYVWLTKQGIYEQITISESKTEAGETWVDTSDKSDETKTAAQQIANNIGRDAITGEVSATVTVSETEYTVTINPDTRELVVTNAATGEAASSSVATDATAATVEKPADKESIQTGATLFAGGSGTENDPWMIVDYDTMQHVTTVSKAMARAKAVVAAASTSYDYSYYASFYGSYHASFGGYDTYDEYFETEWLPYKKYADDPSSLPTSSYYFKVKDGISVIDCSEDSRKWIGVTLFGDFDGNGVTFKNLVGAPLFDEVSSLETRPTTIKNFNVDNCLIMTGSYYVGAVVRVCDYDVSFEDINISGYLEANSPASFLGQGNFYDRDCNISFTRCHSSMNLVSLNAQCGGFTGNLFGNYYNKNHLCTVNLVDSYFDGSLAVASGSRFSYVECHTATPIKYSISYTSDELESQYSSLYSTGHTEAQDVAYLGSTKTLTKGTISLPETGDVITIAKTAGAATAKAYVIVGLNPGNFTGIYVSEEIDLSGVGDSFSTNKVKNYDVIVNDGTHNKTEIIGNTLYIYDTRYESGYGSLTFMIVQYDSLGGIVSVSTKSK